MIAACGSSDWVNSEGWREGLFASCVSEGAATPLPFGAEEKMGCHRAHSAGYIRGTAALVIICVMTDFFGTLLTGLGLRSTDPNKKYKYYRVAIYALSVSVIALFLALIIYPTSFSKDIENGPPLDGGRIQYGNYKGDMDFDNDGILDHLDDDDDNDGIKDDVDDDDDNDGILDADDVDDDNDGILDVNDGDMYETDSDGDGTVDAYDNDDDGDGVDDADEEGVDADNDGIVDSADNDDDNDGILDADEDPDADGDGVPDDEDNDDDNDGTPDSQDNDDDGDGIPDAFDLSGDRRIWEFGFGYGASWASLIFMFVSLVLLICDRESEEIFYKERPAEDDEEEKEEA